MYAFAKQHFGCLCDFSFNFPVYFKSGCSRKPEKLRLIEMPHNILVHITELTAMALVNNENNLLVPISIHNFHILWTLDRICHFLHGSDNKLPVFILHLLYKDIRPVSGID